MRMARYFIILFYFLHLFQTPFGTCMDNLNNYVNINSYNSNKQGLMN